ncbi:hypothetical protein ACFWIN_21190, partial [Streptomyces sp. NPDC127049]|uniref:hypothetical protein n=1 Tax=Streptomyces sp. NPDC127049 TaxID=3347118 RepID=UPI00364CCBDB
LSERVPSAKETVDMANRFPPAEPGGQHERTFRVLGPREPVRAGRRVHTGAGMAAIGVSTT